MTPAAQERLRVRIPLFAVSGAAWLLLAASPHAAAICAMPSMRNSSLTAGSATAGSVLMCAAMMIPLLGGPVRHVRDRSFARRQLRATALFVGGYASLWTAAGVVLLALSALVVDSPIVLAGAVLAIATWQCSPVKQRCLNRCHAQSELSAFGAAADRDALRFGLTHALWCIGSCFALMLLPMLLSRGHLPAMAAVTLWLAGERLEKPAAPRWRWRGPAKAVRIAVGQMRVRLGVAASSRCAVQTPASPKYTSLP
ncbi:MAG: hypothetical protein JWO56_1793 [Acidobacteria bacterium]|nr:hypothetical protein [Acidobacteriota bacterium]